MDIISSGVDISTTKLLSLIVLISAFNTPKIILILLALYYTLRPYSYNWYAYDI